MRVISTYICYICTKKHLNKNLKKKLIKFSWRNQKKIFTNFEIYLHFWVFSLNFLIKYFIIFINIFKNIHSNIIIIKTVNSKSHVLQMAQKRIIRQNDHASILFFHWFKSHLGIFIYFWVPYFVYFHETNSFGYNCISIGSLNRKIFILRVF